MKKQEKEPQQMEMLDVVEEQARAGLADISEVFASKETKPNERAAMAVKLLSIYSRIRATRANEAGVVVGMARVMGLRGEALAPLWEKLTGTAASGLMAPKTKGALASGASAS